MSLRLARGNLEPSFLEVIAAHRLERSVRDAFSYLLSVIADRASEGGLRLLQRDSELFMVFSLIVQGTSLITNGASLAESLYGLRRVSTAKSDSTGERLQMSVKQTLLSWLLTAAAPTAATWIFGDPQAAATGALQESTAHMPEDAAVATDQSPDSPRSHADQPSRRFTASSVLQERAAALWRRIVIVATVARAHGHMATGLLTVAYHVAYLLKVSPFFSPAQHAAGVVLVRDDGSREVARRQAMAATRSRLWTHGVQERAPLSLVAAVALSGMHAIGNNTKTVLMASLVVFKVLEWWFTDGEEKVEEAQRNVPPPPPAYPPHPAGAPLIADMSVCPLCHRKRVAPSLLATSGYVFCYKCAYTAVSAYGRCPVTHIRSSLDDIRRLFLTD